MSPRDGMNKQKIFYSKWKILKKKKKKRDITEYSIILPGVSSDLKQNQRCHLYVGPQSKVCVFSLSLFFLLNLFVGVKEDIAM